MQRRTLMLTAAGLAAATAGMVWQGRQAGDGTPAAVTLDADTQAFWDARFDQLDGSSLPMARLRGRPLVLNFWGSWCPPCVKEMPELDQFHREWAPRGWQVLGLAIDNPRAVRDFLARQPVGYAIALAGFEGSELTRRLGNSAGGLPFTVLFNARGEIVQRKLGETTLAELAGWAARI